jgi:D-alanyl-D-alanine carboxypeptidase
MNPRHTGLLAVVCALVALSATACGNTNATIPTSAPTTISVSAGLEGLDGDVERVVSDWYGPSQIGGAVAVVGTPDGAVHSAAIGEAAPGEPATTNDVMRVGSITKTYTAALVLSITEQGLLALDDSVAGYLPDLDLPERITVRDLLAHTSGITDPDPAALIEAFAADPGHRYTPAELIALARLPDESGPAEFRYASANYHLVGVLIEALTGRTYADLLRTEILERAGLTHTYVAGSDRPSEPIVPGNVDLDGDGREDSLAAISYDAVDTYSWSAGAIATTPADLLTFARALFDGTLLPPSGVDELTDTGGDGYGLGVVDVDPGWGHNGGAPGYQAVFAYDPDRDTAAALFTNCPTCATGTADTWAVIAELIDLPT